MADYQTIRTVGAGAGTATIDAGLRAHMNKVYGLMSVAMVITAGVSWAFGTSPALRGLMMDPMTLRPNMLGWVAMFLPLVMVFAFSAALNRLSVGAAQLFFYAYAAAVGLSLSYIFAIYTGVTIASTFVATAVGFGGMSLYGYTTKRDLSAMGSFFMMGLIGLLVAMVINIFIASSALAFAISLIGVLIFAGLTAFDTQTIKNTYVQHAAGGDQEWLGKAAIMGALNLYLDFINMFMFLLQFMGDRR